jgi:ADP-ribose pyrophosphatase
MSKPVTRVNFERGGAVGVLLYDPDQDAVVLVRQFRYPVYAALSTEARQGEGAREAWLLEIVAGVIKGDQSAPEVGRRELLEEAGYAVEGALNFIATLYPSPGGSSERIHLYWAEVRAAEPAGAGGGLEDEGEDTEVVRLPLRAAMTKIARGDIRDAKTIVALQHLALLRARGNGDAKKQKRPSV